MGNPLLMRIEASYSLNFLVYIQNIFLNENNNKEEHRFPYIPLENIKFKEEFEFYYKELWYEVREKISLYPINDVKIFNDEKDLFYKRLFLISKESLREYDKIHHTFKVWWDSFPGHFSVERSIEEKAEKLYEELSSSLTLKEIMPQKELNISLIYDECLLGNLEVSSYFAVISIEDFFIKYKELLTKLQKSIF